MRTTLNIPDPLLNAARRIAAASGRTLTEVIADALREALARRPGAADAGPVRLPVFGRTGLQPGVDLDDTSALLDLMDSAGGPDRR